MAAKRNEQAEMETNFKRAQTLDKKANPFDLIKS